VPQFLSPEWMDAARAIREKYADQAPPMAHVIRMNQVITGAPFDEGEVRLYMDTSDGNMVMELGELEAPDVTITTDYDTARKIFVDQDPQAGMQAFMSGKVKVQGDMTKLMMLQAGAPNEVAKSIAQEIKDITDDAPTAEQPVND
jgi:putative sterol carrier protein